MVLQGLACFTPELLSLSAFHFPSVPPACVAPTRPTSSSAPRLPASRTASAGEGTAARLHNGPAPRAHPSGLDHAPPGPMSALVSHECHQPITQATCALTLPFHDMLSTVQIMLIISLLQKRAFANVPPRPCSENGPHAGFEYTPWNSGNEHLCPAVGAASGSSHANPASLGAGRFIVARLRLRGLVRTLF